MDFVAVVDQAIALLRQRGRVTYRTLQRQFALDDAQLAALKESSLRAAEVRDDTGRGLVWTGDAGPVRRTAAPVGPLARHPRLHATLSRGENPDLPQRAGRRAQAGHRAVCRPQRLDGADPRPRPRRGPATFSIPPARMMDAVHRYEAR